MPLQRGDGGAAGFAGKPPPPPGSAGARPREQEGGLRKPLPGAWLRASSQFQSAVSSLDETLAKQTGTYQQIS